MTNAVIQNSFTLVASLDGKTFYSQIVPVANTNGFFQFIDKDTKKASPSWNSTTGPKFYQKISDTDGSDPVPDGMPALYWNDKKVEFTNGVSSGSWLPGYFTCSKQSVTDSNNVTRQRWVFQIVKDIFGPDNADSDTFYTVSTVADASGNPIDIRSEIQKVECIQTVSGSTVHVNVAGANIEKGKDTTVLTATVSTPDGTSSAAGTWHKVLQAGDKTLASGTDGYTISSDTRTLTVPKDDVDGSALYRFDVVVGGKTYSGYCVVADLNDPYHAEYTEKHHLTSFSYGKITKGDTVDYTGKVVDGNGEEVQGFNVLFYTRSKSGTPVVNGKETLTVSYNDVMTTYKGELQGYVTASKS